MGAKGIPWSASNFNDNIVTAASSVRRVNIPGKTPAHGQPSTAVIKCSNGFIYAAVHRRSLTCLLKDNFCNPGGARKTIACPNNWIITYSIPHMRECQRFPLTGSKLYHTG